MSQVLARQQLPFQFSSCEIADFDHLIDGPNIEAHMISRSVALGEAYHSIYLWGKPATGKSHLLQAVCDLANQSGLHVVYVPLSQYAKFSPIILEGLDNAHVVCVDDIDHIAGEAEWEQALFCLHNRLREQRSSLLMTGSQGCRYLAFQLQDLKSRIGGDLIYHLQSLSDEDKISLLQKKAKARTLEIPQDVATYLIRYIKRDLPSLLELLDRFDQATLVEKRKLTVPFVKSLLRENS